MKKSRGCNALVMACLMCQVYSLDVFFLCEGAVKQQPLMGQ